MTGAGPVAGGAEAGSASRRRPRRRPVRVEVLGIIDEPVVDGWPLILVRTHDADGQISLRRRTLKRAGELAGGATVLVTKVDRKRGTSFVLPLGGYKDIGWVLKWFVRGRELPCWRRGKDRKWHRLPLAAPEGRQC